MRIRTISLFGLALVLFAAPVWAQESGGPPSAGDPGGIVQAPPQEPPQPPPPPPATPRRPGAGRPEGRRPGPMQEDTVGPPPGQVQPPGGPGGPQPPNPRAAARLDPLLRLIAERRPELAERLEQLRRESPERFRDVLLDALMFRLEDALNEVERGAGPPHPEGATPRPGGAPGSRPRPAAAPPGVGPRQPLERPGLGFGPRPPMAPEEPPPEVRARVRELEERQAKLEAHTRELAGHLRALHGKEAPPDEMGKVKDELRKALNAQFETRSELRKLELERIEQELSRLRTMVEKMQREFERRNHERKAIIEQRFEQLLGGGDSGW